MTTSSDESNFLQLDFSEIAFNLTILGVTAIPLALDKKPLMKGWERGCDGPLDVPAALWREAAGIGVCLGRDLDDGGRLVCLDVDFYTEDHDARAKTEAAILAVLRDLAPEELFPVCRGFKGIKVFLGVTGGAWQGKLKLRDINGHIELLGHRRQAVIPPSRHPKGIVYTWEEPGNDLQSALWFGELPVLDPCAVRAKLAAEGLIEETGSKDREGVSLPAEPVNLAALDSLERKCAIDRAEMLAREAIERIKKAQPGERNDTIAARAFFVGRVAATGVLDRDELLSRVIEAALEVGDDPKKDEDTATRQFEKGEASGAISLISEDVAEPVSDYIQLGTLPGPRKMLFGKFLMRGTVSVTAAPGGYGKSALALAEAVHMAAGKPLVRKPIYPLRVYMWNGEDDADEMHRRVAACMLHYEISERDLDGRLLIPKVAPRFRIAEPVQGGARVNDKQIAVWIEFLKREGVDVFVVDPFVQTHGGLNENDNSQMDVVVSAFREIAREADVAVHIIHHATKESRRDGAALDVAGVRGASALVDACRAARMLIRPSADEMKAFDLRPKDRNLYVYESVGKANYGPPLLERTYYRLHSVTLDNARPPYPPDSVGVAALDAIAETLPELTDRIVNEFLKAMPEEGLRVDVRANDWAGHTLGKIAGIDNKPLLKEWLREMKDRLLIRQAEREDEHRKPRQVWVRNDTAG